MGRSPSITRLKARIPHLSASAEPLVIIGETGVGKTFLAKAIHSRSPRNSLKLGSVNFSILSEREQRVALLGAGPPDLTTTRRSCLEPPSTVVLKHIDHASPFLQEQLAKALETRKVTRLGSNTTHFALARVIFTFKEPLPSLYRKGRIVEPLFLRLRKYKRVTVPPLRKRKQDIPLHAEHFLRSFSNRLHPKPNRASPIISGLTREGKLDLNLKMVSLSQRWPDNITGLKAFLRTLIAGAYRETLREREKIELMKIILMIEEGNEFSLHQSLGLIQRYIIDRALEKCKGKQSQAAAMLGISDRSVRRRPLLTQLTTSPRVRGH
ncbi:MAG: sigma 54-interacting transcriptional regulator [Ignavibacteria bacterium]|nr:sigma 54-interacting transcriptional regulator [Ignavibacteria bacterium]